MASVRRVVVVGASAGGVEALTSFIGALPEQLPAAVLVVLHVAPGGTSVLPGILDRAGPLPVGPSSDGEPLLEGRVYVATPDRHLALEDGLVRVPLGPRENGHRPAVDLLFRSAAATFGRGVVAVVLSGAQDDGTAGAAAVKAAGGRVVVQEPSEALYPSMPQSVLDHVSADAQAGAGELARLVARWVEDGGSGMSGAGDDDQAAGLHEAGEAGASGLTCPECGGAIYVDTPNGVTQLTCHTGHAYSPDSFAVEQHRALESALWSAVRHLDERAALLVGLADRLGPGGSAERFARAASDAGGQADVIRELIARQAPEPA
ncbi:MAG TPA: chemotaxis protein CheB [Solirubrobacteraceae bacterium]